MSAKAYLNIIKYGVYASLLVVFLVFRNLLFPYITSKQIPFNIIMEILLVFWVALIVKYPEYRPKKHYVWFGLVAFFAALIVSSGLGADWNLSFWGDVERMLGVFHLLHFLIFYFLVIAVMRTWNDWKVFLILNIVFSVFISIQSATTQPYATIGNTAYVSGYLIFNMFFCAFLFFREGNKILRWLYLLPLLVQLPGFKAADTSGAYVGLAAGVVFMLLVYGVLHKRRVIKIATIAFFAISFLSITYIFVIGRDSGLVKGSAFLTRMVTDININKNTFQTRLVSWRGAIRDFRNHPVLGTGFGNFALIFDRQFEAKFYDYSRGETYFDRAHNNIIDIASTSGAVGLLTYLSIFAALGYYLVRGYRQDKLTVHDFAVISSLIVAYFVQNLAVFDSLVTYMALMVTLGLVYWMVEGGPEPKRLPAKPLNNPEIYALFFAGAVSLFVMYQYNIKPWKMLIATIDGQRDWSQGDIAATFADYQRALSYDTVLDRDSITSMNRLIMDGPGALSSLDKAKAAEFIEFNAEKAKQVVGYNPQDSLDQMVYSQVLNTAAIFYRDTPDKFAYYSDQALAAIDASIAASPQRIPVYFQKAQIQLNRNDSEGAIATLKQASELNPKYETAFCHLGRTLYFYNKQDEAYPNLEKCLDMNGAGDLQPASFAKTLVNYYVDKEDWPRVAALYVGLTRMEPKSSENWIKLAKLYEQMGDKGKALEAANKVIEIDPSMKQYADEFIKGLQ